MKKNRIFGLIITLLVLFVGINCAQAEGDWNLLCGYEETISGTDETNLINIRLYRKFGTDDYRIRAYYKNKKGDTEDYKDMIGKISDFKEQSKKNTFAGELRGIDSGCPSSIKVNLGGFKLGSALKLLCVAYDDFDECDVRAEKADGWDFNNYDFWKNGNGVKLVSIKKTFDVQDKLANIVNQSIKSVVKKYDVTDMNKSWKDYPICVQDEEGKAKLADKMVQEIKDQNLRDFGKLYPDSWYVNGKFVGAGWYYEILPTNDIIKKDMLSYEQALNILDKCIELINKDEELSDEEKAEKIDEASDQVSSVFGSLSNYLKDSYSVLLVDDFDVEPTCLGFLGEPKYPGTVAYYIQFALKIMRYAAIVLTIVLSSIDFFKAVANQDKDMLKKATMSAAKRLILTVILFFLPVVIDFMMKLLGAYSSCVR